MEDRANLACQAEVGVHQTDRWAFATLLVMAGHGRLESPGSLRTAGHLGTRHCRDQHLPVPPMRLGQQGSHHLRGSGGAERVETRGVEYQWDSAHAAPRRRRRAGRATGAAATASASSKASAAAAAASSLTGPKAASHSVSNRPSAAARARRSTSAASASLTTADKDSDPSAWTLCTRSSSTVTVIFLFAIVLYYRHRGRTRPRISQSGWTVSGQSLRPWRYLWYQLALRSRCRSARGAK